MNELLLRIVWTALAFVGGAYSMWNLTDALADRRAVQLAKRNGVLHLTAGGNIRREAVRLVFYTIAFVVGTWAFALPAVRPVCRTTAGSFLGWALALFLALNVFNSRQDARERREIRRLVEKEGT